MKRLANTLNALCLPLIAAIAFATVVVAETENFSTPARASHVPATWINAADNDCLEAPGSLAPIPPPVAAA